MTARSRHAVESCTLHLHAWKPFQIQNVSLEPPHPSMPFPSFLKKHCRSDRSTTPGAEVTIDLSKLTLGDDATPTRQNVSRFQWFERKRRRPGGGSRSVSGRSSDRSGTRRTRRCCSVGGGGGASGAYATCSDFPVVAGGTDSSGEMFMNGDGNWGSDASEAKISRKEAKDVGGGGGSGVEKDGIGFVSPQGCAGFSDPLGNDSGYGSETGYKGDAEFGYEDEFDEEEDDGRPLFWADQFRDNKGKDFGDKGVFPDMKSHARCRRKKNMGE